MDRPAVVVMVGCESRNRQACWVPGGVGLVLYCGVWVWWGGGCFCFLFWAVGAAYSLGSRPWGR